MKDHCLTELADETIEKIAYMRWIEPFEEQMANFNDSVYRYDNNYEEGGNK